MRKKGDILMQQEKDNRKMSVMNRGLNQRLADTDDFHNGLRILARIIAKAYLKNLALKHRQLKRIEATVETASSKTNKTTIRKLPKKRLALTTPKTTKLLY